MTSKQLHILQHALGVDQYGRGRQYRNHFVTGPGSKDFALCESLAALGFMADGGRRGPLAGGDRCFHVTESGRTAMLAASPQPPKLTRSQRRYRDWLDSPSGMPFIEWLKWLPSRAQLRRQEMPGGMELL